MQRWVIEYTVILLECWWHREVCNIT
jgi:hypothetical protein